MAQKEDGSRIISSTCQMLYRTSPFNAKGKGATSTARMQHHEDRDWSLSASLLPEGAQPLEKSLHTGALKIDRLNE